MRAGMLMSSPAHTPMASFEPLCSTYGDILSPYEATRYHSIVEGLKYLTIIGLNFSFVSSKVWQYLHQPRSSHQSAVKRILGYVCPTIDGGLWYRSSSNTMFSVFSDAY